MMSPERERRVTVASSTRIESGKATGASWWLVKIMPRLARPAGRRDVVGARRPDRVIAVPVAPVEGVHREEATERSPSRLHASTWSSRVESGRGSGPGAGRRGPCFAGPPRPTAISRSIAASPLAWVRIWMSLAKAQSIASTICSMVAAHSPT